MANAGILGGAAGFGKAISQISQEERKNLADKLKMQALEEMNTRMAGVEHGYAMKRQGAQLEAQKEMQGEQIGAQKEMSSERIKAQRDISQSSLEGQMGMNRERIASDESQTSARLRSAEKIAGMENDIKRELMNTTKSSDRARMLQTQAKAAADAMNLINKGGSMDEANAILQAAELPLLEEYIQDPGSEGGPFGIGKKDPVVGYRVQGQKGSGILSSNSSQGQDSEKPADGQQGSKLKQDLDRLLKGGMREGGADESFANIPDEFERANTAGVFSKHYNAPGESKAEMNPDDPTTWDVRENFGRYTIVTGNGSREMTPEEIRRWKEAAQKGM